MMTKEQKKIVDILNEARKECRYQDDCDKCPYKKHGANCLQAMMADYLIKAGVTLPSRCGNCTNTNSECDICNIRKSPFAKKLNISIDSCEHCAIGGC